MTNEKPGRARHALAAVWVTCLALTACGGGGGGDDKGDDPAPGSQVGDNGGGTGSDGGAAPPTGPGGSTSTAVINYHPTVLTAEYLQYRAMGEVTVDAELTVPADQVSFIQIVDPQQHFENQIILRQIDSYTFNARLRFKSQLPGVYTGNLQVRLCLDANCLKLLGGAPSLLPYQLTIAPSAIAPIYAMLDRVDLSSWFREPEILDSAALPRATGLPEWRGHQGGNRHRGHVPVTIDPTLIKPRWNMLAPGMGVDTDVAIQNGIIYFVRNGSFEKHALAIRETDASYVWAQRLDGDVRRLAPVISGNELLIFKPAHEGSSIERLALNTGAKLPSIGLRGRYTSGGAGLMRVNDEIVVWGNGSQQFDLFNANTLAEVQNTSSIVPWYGQSFWSASSDGQYLYRYQQTLNSYSSWQVAGLQKIDATTHQVVEFIEDNSFNSSYPEYLRPPAISDSGRVILVNSEQTFDSYTNHLVCFGNGQVLWKVQGRFRGTPAVADGRIYVYNLATKRVEVFDEASGALLWWWGDDLTPPELYQGSSPLVTDNLLFVSSGTTAYAIDLTTHEVVWTHARMGRFAISDSGLLYLIGGGSISAFNLR